MSGDPFAMYAELDDALDRAAACVSEMHELGRIKSEAERDYRVAKQKRILFERTQNGTPVSIIADVVKGYEDIAELALKRDCAQTDYDANYEAILYWKKRVDVLREQLQREWANSREAV